jgi:hypothetical protein
MGYPTSRGRLRGPVAIASGGLLVALGVGLLTGTVDPPLFFFVPWFPWLIAVLLVSTMLISLRNHAQRSRRYAADLLDRLEQHFMPLDDAGAETAVPPTRVRAADPALEHLDEEIEDTWPGRVGAQASTRDG